MENLNHTQRDTKPLTMFNSIVEWLKSIFVPGEHKKLKDVTHNVAVKQNIKPSSPLKSEQDNFIAEGGNSQPLR